MMNEIAMDVSSLRYNATCYPKQRAIEPKQTLKHGAMENQVNFTRLSEEYDQQQHALQNRILSLFIKLTEIVILAGYY